MGLESWVIQDGNHGDFTRGQTAELAVEFHASEPPAVVASGAVGASRRSGFEYDITGLVTAVVGDAWALDCGLGVYQDARPPDGIGVGDRVAGVVRLGVDPFFYVERLHAVAGFPALVHTWRIEAIWQEVRPVVEAGRVRIPYPDGDGWRSVEHTDAGDDDDGLATYILDGALLDAPPKRSPTP